MKIEILDTFYDTEENTKDVIFRSTEPIYSVIMVITAPMSENVTKDYIKKHYERATVAENYLLMSEQARSRF